LKKILFLSTLSFATNPRLVKEIELALQSGFSVTVVCFEFNNLTKQLNDEIKSRIVPKINYQGIPGNRSPLLPWLISSLLFSLSNIGLFFFPDNEYLYALRSNKRSWQLQQALKKLKKVFNLVVAHNPGSFYPAMTFAKKNKIHYGIDIEDYHPGESNTPARTAIYKKLNNIALPDADYITAASPLILEFSQTDLPVTLKCKHVLLNYFPSAEFLSPAKKNSEKLLMVWFSQNISFHRGLEELIPFIKNNDQIELHLFGNCDERFEKQWLLDCGNIQLHAPLPQCELHQQLAHYDIGLAIEPGKDLNNELALSNKILAYFQAGLYILASCTKAQRRFINERPEHGVLTSLLPDDLRCTIQQLIDQKQSLRRLSEERFVKAKKFNWENESEKLLDIWKEMCK